MTEKVRSRRRACGIPWSPSSCLGTQGLAAPAARCRSLPRQVRRRPAGADKTGVPKRSVTAIKLRRWSVRFDSAQRTANLMAVKRSLGTRKTASSPPAFTWPPASAWPRRPRSSKTPSAMSTSPSSTQQFSLWRPAVKVADLTRPEPH